MRTRKSKLTIAGASAAAGLLMALAVPAGTASAASCDWLSRTISDYSARVDEVGTTCSYLRIRHYYDPVWSGTNYWTNWVGGTGSSYTTANNPVVVYHTVEGS
ncbi:hypothetical protein [Cellulomonas endometrii]|uniref:hypothetical protein n=1 Tax=Cellulomonas endometrii TaxID=3036301 RepID=UPI0024AD41E4|nr:hypothetical protein [Cellulomonas endometrii]